MSCDEIAVNVWVCRTPMKEYSRRPDKVRWCFKCRKHLMHDWVVMEPADPMSYYEPHGLYECPSCKQEHVLFPGREWVYE